MQKETKIVWSIKVHAELKAWFQAYAAVRGTDPQEEVRRLLADFRENNKHQILDAGFTGWQHSQQQLSSEKTKPSNSADS